MMKTQSYIDTQIIKRLTARFLFVVIVIIMPGACVEFEPVSPIPSIDYKSLTFRSLHDTTNVAETLIEYSFIDGDADLGVFDEIHNDTLAPDSVRYGIFIELYEKLNGNYYKRFLIRPIADSPFLDTLKLHQLLPYDSKMDRVGQNKTIKGTIRSGIAIAQTPQYDTMMLEFFIRDRALNKSNVERTDDFSSNAIDSLLKNIGIR